MTLGPPPPPAPALAQLTPRARPWLYLALLLSCGLSLWGALFVGPGDLDDAQLADTLLQLRGMRIASAFLAGAALSVGGVLVQGLFRNPLASPSIVGTTGGATLGGQLVLLITQGLVGTHAIGPVSPELLVPIGCIAGALFALSLVFIIHRADDDLVMLLLLGFILSSVFLALSSLVTSIAQARWELARAMIAFTLGDVSGADLRRIYLATPLLISGLTAALLWGRGLDMMLSGEEEAKTLGVDVSSVRRYTVLWTAVLAAAAVSLGGNVGFVGLVVPHALRPFLGVTHRRLIPGSALLGGTFLVACDTVTRAIPSSTEIPLGVVTSLVGAPMFLLLLMRSRRELTHG